MFSTAERQIFTFHDGHKPRAADPVAVLRRLMSFPNLNLQADSQTFELLAGQLERKGDEAKEPTKLELKVQREGIEAWGRILDATRHAFEVEAFHLTDQGERGLTDGETLLLFKEFMDWFNGLKKNTVTTQTLPTSTAPKS